MREPGNISCKQDWKLHVVTRICENSKGQAEGMGVPKEKTLADYSFPLEKNCCREICFNWFATLFLTLLTKTLHHQY